MKIFICILIGFSWSSLHSQSNFNYFSDLPLQVESQDSTILNQIYTPEIIKAQELQVIQQSGLNTNKNEALNTYFRYTISKGNYSNLIQPELISEKTIRTAMIEEYKINKQNGGDCNGLCTFKVLNSDTCLIGGHLAIQIAYSRKSKINKFKDEDLLMTSYLVFAKNYMYELRASYLLREIEKWKYIVTILNKSIKLK